MKKYINILLILLGFVNCDADLDLVPEDTLVEDKIFQNAQTVDKALLGAYKEFAKANIGDSYILGDYTTDNTLVNPADRSSFAALLNLGDKQLTRNSIVSDIWANHYSAINMANVLIEKIPVYGNYGEKIKNEFLAEARFIRALTYFGLLKLYGDGALTGGLDKECLPLRLESYKGFNTRDIIKGSSNQMVYKQIIMDLEFAGENLPDRTSDNKAQRIGRAFKSTAYGLLSRVYLYKREYQKCIEACDKTLQNKIFRLSDNLKNVFPNNRQATDKIAIDDEVLFAIPISYNQGNWQFGSHKIYFQFGTSLYSNPEFIKRYPKNDIRANYNGDLSKGMFFSANKNYVTVKFSHKSFRDNLCMLRLSEIYLNKAEALAHQNGVNAKSVEILNKIYLKNYKIKPTALKLGDFTTTKKLIDRILLERDLELAYEGIARYDLIRTDRKLQNKNLNKDKYVLPIPQSEIDITNGAIIQNQGYK